jgi:cell division protein FtsB
MFAIVIGILLALALLATLGATLAAAVHALRSEASYHAAQLSVLGRRVDAVASRVDDLSARHGSLRDVTCARIANLLKRVDAVADRLGMVEADVDLRFRHVADAFEAPAKSESENEAWLDAMFPAHLEDPHMPYDADHDHDKDEAACSGK